MIKGKNDMNFIVIILIQSLHIHMFFTAQINNLQLQLTAIDMQKNI